MQSLKLNLKSKEGQLFWSSVLLLLGEVLAIRWFGIEVPLMHIFPNLVLLVVLVGASAGVGNPTRYKTPTSLLMGALCVLFVPLIFSVQLGIPALSVKFDAASHSILLCSIAILLLIVVSLLAVFVNVGGLIGKGFATLPPLRAYSINLAGSIIGVLLVALISLAHLPPPFWILLCGLVTWAAVQNKFVPIVTAIVIASSLTTTLSSKWSPYSKLDVIPLAMGPNSAIGPGNYVLNEQSLLSLRVAHAG